MTIFHRQKMRAASGGFTLLEMLIYLLITGLALTAAVTFSYHFAAAKARSFARQETEHNAQLAAARIAIEVREAVGYNEADSVLGGNPGRLSLAVADPANDPTVFFVANGVLYIQRGAGPELPLTSSHVSVNDFTVDRLSSSDKHRVFRIRVQAVFNSDNPWYAADTVLETTAQIKRGDGYSD